jgi:hypothetical protein
MVITDRKAGDGCSLTFLTRVLRIPLPDSTRTGDMT